MSIAPQGMETYKKETLFHVYLCYGSQGAWFTPYRYQIFYIVLDEAEDICTETVFEKSSFTERSQISVNV